MTRFIATLTLVVASLMGALPAGAAPVRPLVVPAIWRTGGPGISYPDATDPTRLLPRIVQLGFACIRRFESRNHLVDGNANTGEGWYQFIPSTFHSGAVALHFPLRVQWSANLATGDQQSAVAVWYWNRNRRFGVQWPGDASRCPGTFFF